MSAFAPETFEEAKLTFKPLRRGRMSRQTDSLSTPRKPLRPRRIARNGDSSLKRQLSSAVPYAVNSLKTRKKPKKVGRKKLRSMKALKKLVWRHFSIFVRTSSADSNGYVACVTCSAVYLWNSGEIHAGHWIHNRLDYDPRNVHPQCVKCNYRWNTNVSVSYSIFMARTYGVEVMDELRLLSHTHGNRYTRIELDELLEKYKALNAANPLLQD